MIKNDTESIIRLGLSDIDQEIQGLYYVMSISWVGDKESGRDIAIGDDFLLHDSSGFPIASKRAIAAGDDFGKSFCAPLAVNGLNLKELDGGICFVYLKAL